MKNFKVEITQPLWGYSYAELNFEAEDEEDALNRLSQMDKYEISEKANWAEDDYLEYDGEIEIQYHTLKEI